MGKKGIFVMKIINGVKHLSTWDIIKTYCYTKIALGVKHPVSINRIPPEPTQDTIYNLAIVLDDEVQDIMRAQGRLAALLVSNPKFIEFDPEQDQPAIGWLVNDGNFINPNQED